MMASSLPSKASFGEQVGSTFEVVFPDVEAMTATLTDLTEGHQSPGFEQFSMVFTGPAEAPIQQGMCHLDHAVLGTMDLFLVPIGRDASGGLQYEAVFNRVHD
jgi:hypothetical protein